MKYLKHILTACILLVTTQVYGQISVSMDGPIKSISEAIKMAVPGSRIDVQNGVYEESGIQIDKSIELVGIGMPVVNGMGNGFIFIVRADSVTINDSKSPTPDKVMYAIMPPSLLKTLPML